MEFLNNYIDFFMNIIDNFYDFNYISEENFVLILYIIGIITMFIFSPILYKYDSKYCTNLSQKILSGTWSIIQSSVIGTIIGFSFGIVPGLIIGIVGVSPILLPLTLYVINFEKIVNWFKRISFSTPNINIKFNTDKKKIKEVNDEYFNLLRKYGTDENNMREDIIIRKHFLEDQLNNLLN